MVRAAFVERVKHGIGDRGRYRGMEQLRDIHILRGRDRPYSPAFRIETAELTRISHQM